MIIPHTQGKGFSLRDLQWFAACCAAFVVIYLAARWQWAKCKLPKIRCWILTCVNSVVTPLLSFRSLFRIVNNKWEYEPVVGGSTSSRFCTVFFMAYLACELVVGTVDYRKQVSLVMGYVHHASYLALSLHLLHENRTNILAMTLLEELPTLILACDRLGGFENALDFAFGLTFVLTRIAFHLYVQWHMYLWRKDPALQWYWLICSLAFAMNVYWLIAWWKSVQRRRQKYRLKYGRKVPRKRFPSLQRRFNGFKAAAMASLASRTFSKHSGELGQRITSFKLKQRLLISNVRLRSNRQLKRIRQDVKALASTGLENLKGELMSGDAIRRRGQRIKRATETFLKEQRTKLRLAKPKSE